MEVPTLTAQLKAMDTTDEVPLTTLGDMITSLAAVQSRLTKEESHTFWSLLNHLVGWESQEKVGRE